MIRHHLLAFAASFLVLFTVGCLDFSGAPCTTSSTCPNAADGRQMACISGVCQPRSGTVNPKECTPCTATSECGAGLECGRRSCDGTQACFSPDGTCAQVNGVACPAVVNFRECTSTTECGTGSACLYGRCLQACTTSDDCYLPNGDFSATVATSCVRDSTGDTRCYPACTGQKDAVCGPLGSYCERFASNNYGYCELGCGGCSTTADCAPGFECGSRRCDGVGGCFPLDGGACTSISLYECPASNNFETCTVDTDCGQLATCKPYGSASRCLQTCTGDATCAELFADGAVYDSICRAQAPRYCVASCTGTGATCPTGTVCRQGTDARWFCQ